MTSVPIVANDTSGIIVPDGVSLRGASRELTILRFRGTPTAGGAIVTVSSRAACTVLQDLAIAGPLAKFGSYDDVNVQGVFIGSKSTLSGTVVLRRVWISGCNQGIHVATNVATGNTLTLAIVDCDLQSFQALMFAGQGRCFVYGTDVHGCGINTSSNPSGLNQRHGLYLYPGVSLEVVHCRFADYAPKARGYAILVYGSESSDHGDYCRIVGCTIDATHYGGILTNNNRPTQVIGCTIGAASSGIELTGGADILGCTVDGPATALKGYYLAKPLTACVQSCRFLTTVSDTVQVQPLVAGSVWKVTSCHFPNHTSAQAITIDPGTKIICQDCSFSNSTAPGVSTSANLPDPTRLGAGARWFDLTLCQMLASDGAAWRLAPNVEAPAHKGSALIFPGNVLGATTSPNLLTTNQADIETNTAGWVDWDGASVAQTSVLALHGHSALRITSRVNGQPSVATSNRVPVVAGHTITALASFRAATVPREVQVDIYPFNAVGKQMVRMARASSNRETTTGWVQVAATGTVPSGTATVRVVLRINDATVGESHYVDQVSLATGTSTLWRAPGTISRSSDGSNLEGDIFANANTIILMGRTRDSGRLGRALYVAKHRASACGDEIRPYRITDQGVVFE